MVDELDPAGTPRLVIGDVDALLMPDELAAQVHHVLSIHLLAGAVIGYREQWALLTGAAGNNAVPTDLAGWNVAGFLPGDRLTLPFETMPGAEARWIQHPDPTRPQPPWQTVVSATRRAMSLAHTG
ncbi:hypothetical protein [Parasphingorhabdus pacifica]